MNIVQKLINTQSWIEDITSSSVAKSALMLVANKTIKSKYRREIRMEAARYGVPYEKLLAFNLSYEAAILTLMVDSFPSIPEAMKMLGRASKAAKPVGCTTVGVQRSGKVEFWRNLDWDDPDKLLMNNSLLLQKDHWTSVSFPGAVGVLTAYRKHSYAIAINAICIDGDGLVLGTPPTFLVREVLDTCATYAAAVELLCHRELLCPVIFTIVAADGRMMVIERGSTTYATRGPEPLDDGGHAIVATNGTRRLSTDKPATALGDLARTSDARYDGVWDNLTSPTSMEDVMTDAEFGCTIHTVAVTFGNEEPVELFFAK